MSECPTHRPSVQTSSRSHREKVFSKQLGRTVQRLRKELVNCRKRLRLLSAKPPTRGQPLDRGAEELFGAPSQNEKAELTFPASGRNFQHIFDQAAVGIMFCSLSGRYLKVNPAFADFVGYSREELRQMDFKALTHPDDLPTETADIKEILHDQPNRPAREKRYLHRDGSVVWGSLSTTLIVDDSGNPSMYLGIVQDIDKRKLAEEAIERRILTLTQPLEDASAIRFEDLFNLEDIQNLQDEFAKATGVSSIITSTDGSPITRPSNFTRLCSEIVRESATGQLNCLNSAATLGRLFTSGPTVRPCLSAGLWNAGAGISVGGRHIANWLIGQVRDGTQTEEDMRRYAREIKTDEEEFLKAFHEVPIMPKEYFEHIAKALFTLANRLSTTAYQNVQQARFIAEIKRTRDELRESENRLRFALEGANQGIWDVRLPDKEVFLCPRAWKILGRPEMDDAHLSGILHQLVHPEDLAVSQERLSDYLAGKTSIYKVEQRMRMPSGGWKWILTRGKVAEYADNGQPKRMIGTYTDITERKQIEMTQLFLLERGPESADEDFLKALARFLAKLLQMDMVCISSLENDKLTARTLAFYCDGQLQKNITYNLQGTPCENVLSNNFCCYKKGVQDLFPADTMLHGVGAESYIGMPLWNSGGKRTGIISLVGRKPLPDCCQAESILRLVAIRAVAEMEQRRAEKEKKDLEAQLIQTQKMESIGHLAGGIAHDFNNMLGVILGHVELAQEQLSPAQPLYDNLREIKHAARRSADLTSQLLAFARKQTASPKILDLNETVEGLLKMLRRLIGEEIKLAWLPEKGVWPVRIDPTQVHQILANLTVNARDAIQDQGKITISTNNKYLDEEYCSYELGLVPGSYVMLSVSDDGCGMDRDTQKYIFEPFYTTKGVGKGTGLGLATTYGIVKQNNGFIYVYSEPDQGTTFKIYLPQHSPGINLASAGETMRETLPQGKETILLVEDEPAILGLVKRMLQSLGYQVLSAQSPAEAVELAERQAGRLQLLISDVIMPEMNGRALATRLLSFCPDLKCLYMSGYTSDVIAQHGVLEEGVQFIQKPFSKRDLSVKVRETLAGGTP